MMNDDQRSDRRAASIDIGTRRSRFHHLPLQGRYVLHMLLPLRDVVFARTPHGGRGTAGHQRRPGQAQGQRMCCPHTTNDQATTLSASGAGTTPIRGERRERVLCHRVPCVENRDGASREKVAIARIVRGPQDPSENISM